MINAKLTDKTALTTPVSGQFLHIASTNVSYKIDYADLKSAILDTLSNVDNTSDLDKPVSTAQQAAIDQRVYENSSITGATKTKITYDEKGLVTAGADATTADIAASTDKNYVTDAEAVVIGNTSGTNTGDQTITLTGDVTGSGTGSFAATIATDSVTTAKILDANVTEAKLSSAVQNKLNNTFTNKTDATTAPGVSNDNTEGYSVGSFWLDVTADESYRCMDASTGAAVWIKTSLSVDELGALAVLNTVDTAQINNSAVTNDKLAGSIDDSKLSTITTANKVSGSAVQLATNSALADSTGLDVTVDNSTIENATGTLRIKDDGVVTAKIADSNVTLAKIANAVANDKLLGSGAAGSGSPYSEITLGTNLSMSGTTLNASGGGGISDGDKGDVTVSSSGTVWTIDSDAVTYDKMQDASANTILGSVAGGTVEEISCTGAGRAILDDADASAQRTTLGVAIGSDVQAYDLVLDEVAAQTVTTESTTSRTLALTDANDYIRCTNASATTITVPANSTVAFPIGTQIDVFQAGAGQVSFAAAGGVTINKAEGLNIAAQYKAASLKKVATDEWDLIGALAA